MNNIEINDFKVNDRVIVKRLARRGYKRFENSLNITDEKGKIIKVFSKDDDFKETIKQNKEDGYKKTDKRVSFVGRDEDIQDGKGSTIVSRGRSKREDNSMPIVLLDEKMKIKENSLKVNDIIELIDRKEEIFKMLDIFKNMSGNMGDNLSDNINDSSSDITIRLPNPKDNQFKATIRLNDVVWEQFREFAKKYPFFTTKDLVSQALVDFMSKHNK